MLFMKTFLRENNILVTIIYCFNEKYDQVHSITELRNLIFSQYFKN